MTTPIEYALMAGASYFDTREEINRFPDPIGWIRVSRFPAALNNGSGFEASAFGNGSTLATSTEIVISFAGTYDIPTNPLTNPDMLASAGLATGVGSAQLLQAVEYYLQVKAANPGATITLTGHSLGGGLAALVGVFFGVGAQTFDQAPFAKTAWFGATDLMTYLVGKLDASGNRIYSDAVLAPLTSYIAQKDAFGVPTTFIPNAGLVTNINVQGEFLSSAPWTIYSRIGTTTEAISNTATGVSGQDLHAQALLAAFLQSRQTATSGKALNEVTVKLPDLLQMIFDPKLFSYRTDDSVNRNLVDHLVRHEAGVQGSFVADAMVTRFTTDLWRIAQDGGLTLTEANVRNALTAFAMQKYYEEASTSPGYKKELFTDLSTAGTGSNGIRFDMVDVSTTFKTAFDNNDKLNLADAKGFDLYFKNYLGSSNTSPPPNNN